MTKNKIDKIKSIPLNLLIAIDKQKKKYYLLTGLIPKKQSVQKKKKVMKSQKKSLKTGKDVESEESDEFEYGVRRNNYINNLVINNYYKFNKLIAITKTVKKEYEKINISEDKIELIPNGVDYKRFKEFKSIFDIRRKHNIPHDAKIILSVGRQHPKKNYNIISFFYFFFKMS